VLPARAGVSP